jgi:hypothetical protein
VETQRVFVPSLFWSPLTEAATLGKLGRLEEARAAAKTLLELKPDFEGNARVLIGHYIKFEEIVERIIDGLRKSGLAIE